MDGPRFDDLARAVAAGSRRRFLASLAGGAIAALFGRPDRSMAAMCRPLDRTCREHADCCSGICGAKDATGRLRCACSPSLTACDDACHDLQTDPAHCGACDLDCAALPNVAAAGCAGGLCAITACAAGYGDCDQDPLTGCETSLGTDDHCAGCLDTCDPAAGEACLNGACEVICVPSGGTCNYHNDCCNGWCNGACVPATCAQVGDACDFNEDCCSGVCQGNQVCVDCIPTGEPCLIVEYCCGKICANGYCADLACIGLGGSCDLLNDNCCAGGSCVGTCL
jgi:hypothetical protein